MFYFVVYCDDAKRRSQQKNKTLFGLFNQKSFEGLLIFISINNKSGRTAKLSLYVFFLLILYGSEKD